MTQRYLIRVGKINQSLNQSRYRLTECTLNKNVLGGAKKKDNPDCQGHAQPLKQEVSKQQQMIIYNDDLVRFKC